MSLLLNSKNVPNGESQKNVAPVSTFQDQLASTAMSAFQVTYTSSQTVPNAPAPVVKRKDSVPEFAADEKPIVIPSRRPELRPKGPMKILKKVAKKSDSMDVLREAPDRTSVDSLTEDEKVPAFDDIDDEKASEGYDEVVDDSFEETNSVVLVCLS